MEAQEEASGGDVVARNNPSNGWFQGEDCSDFRRRFSGKEFDKAGIDGPIYVFNKRKSDKDTRQIQKVQQGGKDDGKEIALVSYSGVATVNENTGENENTNESKEHISDQGKGRHAGGRFG